jgi:ABC-type glycerol-3-phosphate transport system permease component
MNIHRIKRYSLAIAMYTFLVLIGIVVIYPFLWMFLTSFKLSEAAIFNRNLLSVFLFRDVGLANYIVLGNFTSPPLLTMTANTFIYAALATAINAVVSFFAAYMLAKHKVIGGRIVFFFFLSLMIIPQEVITVPLYLVLNSLHMINTYHGIILSLSAEALSIVILYRFFREIPDEIIDAAYIDGSSELRLMFSIILPLSWSAIMTAILIQFISAWNAFIIPLVTAMDEKLYNLQIGMAYFSGALHVDFKSIMSLGSIITIPILAMYILTQKRIVRGITSGAIK